MKMNYTERITQIKVLRIHRFFQACFFTKIAQMSNGNARIRVTHTHTFSDN